ncbi:MAG: CRTAC1 family protein [Polymorphobacter sp.]|uniref:CRTAC1 family protein n=1 Tax=Polymorphobacter sp. TaxID=1909290 RepID=UPI003A8648EB
MRIFLIAAALAAPAAAQLPPLTPVQEDMFSVPGSLSNAWADFDGDGDLDFAVSLKGGAIRLYRNDGGSFVDVGPQMGLPGADGGEYRGLSWTDFDQDGQLDLFAGSALRDRPSHLFRRTGDRFEDVAPALGLTLTGRSSRQNNFIDYDNDGDLDLFITDRLGGNKLFRNDGGAFVQVMAAAPISAARSTVGACWLDFDRDGDLDLFLANQSGKEDSLFRNDGDAFVDVAAELGVNSPGRLKTEGGVGCAIGDYDGDGHLDIFVPGYGPNRLWRGLPGGSFEDAATKAGVAEDAENHAVGPAFGDMDNDGRPELSVMSYHGAPGEQVPANRLYYNEGNGRLVNRLVPGSPADRGDHGTALVDFDGDGDLDLAITKGYNVTGGHFLFRNELAAGPAARSIQVMVLDADGRATQAGAEVRVYAPGGALIGSGQVSTGGGYGAQHVMPVHFGLGRVAMVDIEVSFMSAGGRVVQRMEGVPAGPKPVVVRRAR